MNRHLNANCNGKPRMIGRWLGRVSAVATVLCCASARAYADVAPIVAQMKVDKSGGKNYVVESLITVVLIGGVLFLICKSSRRT